MDENYALLCCGIVDVMVDDPALSLQMFPITLARLLETSARYEWRQLPIQQAVINAWEEMQVHPLPDGTYAVDGIIATFARMCIIRAQETREGCALGLGKIIFETVTYARRFPNAPVSLALEHVLNS